MRIDFAYISSTYLWYGIIAFLLIWLVVIRLRRAAGSWRLRYYAFPRTWLQYVHQHVPLYHVMPWELRAPYQDKVLQFVDSKGFRACGSLDEVTDEMRLAIAGNACVLLLNGSGEGFCEGVFPGLLNVQVFSPSDPHAEARSSCVAVYWDDQSKRATDPRDRGNADLPAIAKKLGWETAGKPALPEVLLLTAWARMRVAEFVKDYAGVLEAAAGITPQPAMASVAAGDDTALPAPSVENSTPGDIFAVATEMFMAVPQVLHSRQPALYTALRAFYKIDPARWTLRK